MHVALVHMDGEKMSKSLGNLVFVDQLRETWDPRAIRLAIIEHHYRVEWEWDDELMPRNAARLDALERAAPGRTRDAARRGASTRSTTTSTRPGRSRRSTTPLARGEGVGEAAALLGVDLD